jgi:hypothetical protein
VVVAVVLLLLVVLAMLVVEVVAVHQVVMVETHQTLKLDQLVVLAAHREVLAVLVLVLELLQPLDPHYKVALVDKVLDLIQTGLVVAVEVLDIMAAVAAAAVTMMDLELVPLLVVVEDLDT